MPIEGITTSLARGAIKEVLVGLWPTAEHTIALVTYVVVLGCPLTHLCLQECELIVSECDSSALPYEIASSGIRCSSCKPVVLVTFGGCHLLDGSVASDSVEAREKIVRCSEGEFARGIVLTSRGREEQL
jgi:hypothetical protein